MRQKFVEAKKVQEILDAVDPVGQKEDRVVGVSHDGGWSKQKSGFDLCVVLRPLWQQYLLVEIK